MPLQAATPILRIFDEAKAREFYLDFLGFRLDWQHRFDDHAPSSTCTNRRRACSETLRWRNAS